MGIHKVDKTKFKRDTWETDWYVCPSCGFDSLDACFNHCPNCGEGLSWEDEEKPQKEEPMKCLGISVCGDCGDYCPAYNSPAYKGE